MWDAIGGVLTSQNGALVAILLFGIVLMAYVAMRIGRLKITGDKIKIGTDAQERERTVIRNQLDWMRDAVFAFERQIDELVDEKDVKKYNNYRTKYILAMLYIGMSEWVLYNHIDHSQHYLEIKRSDLWNKVLTMTEKEELQSDEFKNMVFAEVERIIEKLILIRKEYEK